MYTLVLWTIVAVSGATGPTHRDWRHISEHHTLSSCEAAGAQLGKLPTQFRCLKK